MAGGPTPLKLCWVKGQEEEVQTSLDKMTMILSVDVGDKTIEVDLRGILHASNAIHEVTRCGALVLRTTKDGAFSGLINELKKNPYTTFSQAVVARARRLADKRNDKRKRDEVEGTPPQESAENDDVEFVKERTRQDRDNEGMANAESIE